MVNKLSVCLHRVSPRHSPTRCQCRSPPWAKVRARVGQGIGGLGRRGGGLPAGRGPAGRLGRMVNQVALALPCSLAGRVAALARSLGSGYVRRQKLAGLTSSRPRGPTAGGPPRRRLGRPVRQGVLTHGVLTRTACEPRGTNSRSADSDGLCAKGYCRVGGH